MTPADADDDDALRWDGDESARAAAPAASARRAPRRADADADAAAAAALAAEDAPVLPEGFEAVGKGAEGVGTLHADGTVTLTGERPPLSNTMLVTLGVLAGVHALYAVGWAVAGLRLLPISAYLVAADGVAPPLWQGASIGALVLAAAAPIVWFAAGIALTRTTRAWVRIVVIVAGVVLLVPWPLFSVPAVAA